MVVGVVTGFFFMLKRSWVGFCLDECTHDESYMSVGCLFMWGLELLLFDMSLWTFFV